MSKQGKLNIDLDLNDNLIVYQNITQDVVFITKDKLELVLIKAEKCLSQKKAWIAPLGLVVSCLLSILSADFKNFFFPSSVWYSIFIMTTFICFFWFCYTIYVTFRNKNKGNIEDIINKIIAESKVIENN